jgi:hypothetical protein
MSYGAILTQQRWHQTGCETEGTAILAFIQSDLLLGVFGFLVKKL